MDVYNVISVYIYIYILISDSLCVVHVSWRLWTVEIVDNAAMLSLSPSLSVCLYI